MNSKSAQPVHAGRLAGRAVFLSASVPSEHRSEIFRRLPDAPREIEQAVVSLARAVFGQGGRLVFGGHPSIAPLVASVASEYIGPGEVDPNRVRLVTIHQLDIFKERREVPDVTLAMQRLGVAEIVWHRTTEVDRHRHWRPDEEMYLESLTPMRAEMARTPGLAAMVAIGGMEGVLREAEAFQEGTGGQAPIFALARTGGAAVLLTDRMTLPLKPPVTFPDVEVIDREILGEGHLPAPMLRGTDGETRAVPLRYVPYPLIMERLLSRL